MYFRKERFISATMWPYGAKNEKFIRVVVRPIRNEISFERARASRG